MAYAQVARRLGGAGAAVESGGVGELRVEELGVESGGVRSGGVA